MAVSVVFAQGSVRLLLAGDTVGEWPMSEVRFVPAESGYEMQAEGDSLPFIPHDGDAFDSFIRGEPDPSLNSPPPSPEPLPSPVTERVPSPWEQTVPEPTEDPYEGAGVTSLDLGAGLADPEADSSLLPLDDDPDEFFAAGWNGPPSQSSAPPFRSPLATPPDAESPSPAPGSSPVRQDEEQESTGAERSSTIPEGADHAPVDTEQLEPFDLPDPVAPEGPSFEDFRLRPPASNGNGSTSSHDEPVEPAEPESRLDHPSGQASIPAGDDTDQDAAPADTSPPGTFARFFETARGDAPSPDAPDDSDGAERSPSAAGVTPVEDPAGVEAPEEIPAIPAVGEVGAISELDELDDDGSPHDGDQPEDADPVGETPSPSQKGHRGTLGRFRSRSNTDVAQSDSSAGPPDMPLPLAGETSPARAPAIQDDVPASDGVPIGGGAAIEEFTAAGDGGAETEATHRGMLGRFRGRATSSVEAQPGTPEHLPGAAGGDQDDTPQPLDDAENLRQWGLIVAGGLVIVVVIVMVVWGLVAILGGEPTAPEEVTPTTSAATEEEQPEAAPEPTTPSPTVAPTPASAEETAAGQAFVSDWNGLASKFATQLTIPATDGYPIASAPEPNIHLTYDGALRLSMAPKGNGTDRDILLAMGLAIAWADPAISPEGRKGLLAELGVDVDNPNLADMGGEVNRSGIIFRAEVDDSILTFEVDPSA